MSRNRAALLGVCAVSILALFAGGCGSAPIDRAPGPEGASEVSIDLPERRVILPASAPEAPPATDIHLLDFDPEVVPWRVVETKRLTDRDGYDNQPYFEEDGESLLFVSMVDGQTDIFRYSNDGAVLEQLTATSESEYSPTPIPGWPGFSTVRVEADETQRLWRFPRSSGEGRGSELVFAALAPVGYHCWIDGETAVMFVLGEPNRMVLGNVTTGEARSVATDIGRALHRVPGETAVSYVDKTDPERWWIATLDLATGRKRRLVETPSGSEDFIWWSARELLIGDGSKLYVFDLDLAQYWREVTDLSAYGIEGITRLSRSPTGNRLAVVGTRSAD